MRSLTTGDLVAIVAPSGPVPPDRYARGKAVLEARGYRVRELSIDGRHRYLSAPDEVRARSLAEAFADPEVAAIFAGRGGYGAMRLLPRLDLAAFAASGKALVGFSDVTALHLALYRAGGRSVHGPVVTRLGEEPPDSVERLFSILERRGPPAPIPGRTLVAGVAEGPVIGGCLSLVSRLVGTPYLPALDGAILFLEEIDERPYRLDRMWTHLSLAGVLDRVAGIALGDLTGCDEPDGSHGGAEVLEELVRALGKPAIAGLPVGHGKVNLAIPHGARGRLEGGALSFLEGLS